MSDYNDEIDEVESRSNGQILELIMRDYVPYWPVIVVFSFLGLFLGNAYLQTQVPVFRSTAKILLKDETQQSSESMLKQAVTGVNQSNVDGELEIITSANVMRNAAILAQTQLEYRWDGRIRTLFEDPTDVPFQIVIDTFNVTSGIYILEIFPQEKKIIFGGSEYTLGKPFEHEGNRLSLTLKPGFEKEDYEKYKSDANHTFYVHLYDLESAASRMGGSFSASKDEKKEFLLHLAITNTHAKTGKRWLQAIIESYQKETQLEKQKKNRFMMEFITDRLDYLGRDLDSIEKEMVNFQKETKLDFRTKTAEKVLGKVDSRSDVTDDLETQLFMLDELEKYLKGQLKEPIMIPPAISVVDVEILNTGFMDLYTMEREFSATKETLGEQSDKMRAAMNEINLQKRVLTETVNNARKTILILKEKARNEISGYYQEYENMMGDLPATELAYLEIKKQAEIKNSLYTFLLQRREEAAIQVAGTTSDIQVVKEPGGAEQISPKPVKILGTFTGVAAGLVLLVLFIKSASNNKILSRSEIERRTSIPVVGEIIQTETDSPLIMKEGNRSLIAEQFRGLRTNLSYLGKDPARSTFLISSSLPGEGKSFVAANIAIGYAMTGKRTIIIESDLRKPNIAKHFNLSRRTGLSVFLSGNANEKDIVFGLEEYPNLYVLPAGPIPPNPVELIMNGKYKQLVLDLQKDFDYVIIDCPPIGLVTDAFEIGSFVDYALFITRHRYTPREAISGILERANRDKKFKQTAIILNGLKGGISGYGYGYSYGYGSYGYGYGYSYGYGYGYGQSYGYGYYGSEKKSRNRLAGLLWNIIVAPFGAFFGKKK